MAENEVQFNEEEYADFGQPPAGNQENQAGGEQQDQDFFGENHGNEPGHTVEEGGEYQGYEAHHQENQQGGDFGQAQYQDQGHFEQHQQGGHTGGDDYDDFFGSQAKPQGGDSSAQFKSSQQAFGMPSGGSPGIGGGMNAYDPNYDPEEEERLERLRRIEQERNQRLDQKAREEREKKQEKIAEAAKELARWHSERDQNNEKRRQINKQNQEIQNDTKAEEEYKNPWDKIVGNIATKEGEYPGSKDVTRFRQSLINKKADEAKGGVEKLGLF